jgi:hypothetical protein
MFAVNEEHTPRRADADAAVPRPDDDEGTRDAGRPESTLDAEELTPEEAGYGHGV